MSKFNPLTVFTLQLRTEFEIDSSKLKQITDYMLSEMDAGLASAGTSSLLMIPTHLTSVPTGKETGSYLALDLGGTNFRVLKVGMISYHCREFRQVLLRFHDNGRSL